MSRQSWGPEGKTTRTSSIGTDSRFERRIRGKWLQRLSECQIGLPDQLRFVGHGWVGEAVEGAQGIAGGGVETVRGEVDVLGFDNEAALLARAGEGVGEVEELAGDALAAVVGVDAEVPK